MYCVRTLCMQAVICMIIMTTACMVVYTDKYIILYVLYTVHICLSRMYLFRYVCMNGRVEVLFTSYWGEGHKKDRARSDKTSMSPAE